ncbi:uncharacterized protein [Canis lupus baileyi]|uniref:uncharacterized protein n=1 Tax=Canis lupus baileyi TaxID=143281 RepID=UPI003B9794E7
MASSPHGKPQPVRAGCAPPSRSVSSSGSRPPWGAARKGTGEGEGVGALVPVQNRWRQRDCGQASRSPGPEPAEPRVRLPALLRPARASPARLDHPPSSRTALGSRRASAQLAPNRAPQPQVPPPGQAKRTPRPGPTSLARPGQRSQSHLFGNREGRPPRPPGHPARPRSRSPALSLPHPWGPRARRSSPGPSDSLPPGDAVPDPDPASAPAPPPPPPPEPRLPCGRRCASRDQDVAAPTPPPPPPPQPGRLRRGARGAGPAAAPARGAARTASPGSASRRRGGRAPAGSPRAALAAASGSGPRGRALCPAVGHALAMVPTNISPIMGLPLGSSYKNWGIRHVDELLSGRLMA